jgi:hypothetical protein
VLEDFLVVQRRVGHRSKQEPVGAGRFCIPRQALCVIRAKRANTDDDRRASAQAIDGGLDCPPPLAAREIHVGTRASEQADGGDPGGAEAAQQNRQVIDIHTALLVGRRDREGGQSVK